MGGLHSPSAPAPRSPSRLAAAVVCALLVTGCAYRVSRLFLAGDSRELRHRHHDAPRTSPGHPGILLLALDGVDRSLLYGMLAAGELPGLATLLGGDDGGLLPHAYLDRSLVSTLPSTTMDAWVTALTGVPPAYHGIAGNEFFMRERAQLAAPAPVTFADVSPTLACFSDDYLDHLVLAPSVYERLREREPDILVWVAMQQFHAGADRLLLTDRAVIAKGLEAFVEDRIESTVESKRSRAVFAKLDGEIVDDVADRLGHGPLPDVLTVYLSGTDSYAHVAEEGPDDARRDYLREVLDPLFARLAERLEKRGGLANRWVVVTSDHGHTQVLHDDAHSLSTEGDGEPPALVEKAGFRVRPFELDVPADADFQAVLAYQGAIAYVYVADRSTCREPGQRCDWTRPPRLREDVLALAEAFHRNNRDGSLVPALKGTLDMILARAPRAGRENARPFQVYVGHGRLEPVSVWLRRHPHPTYVDLESRLRDLAVGPNGDRAGDILLIAHNGDRATPEERYYFAALYHSWHGSPSRKDSEVPLIVARPERTRDAIAAVVDRVLGARPHQQKVTDLLLALRDET